MPRCRRALRISNGQRDWLNLGDGRRSIRPPRFDDREGAGLAQYVEQIGRRILGNHDHRTQERHDTSRLEQRNAVTLGKGD